MIGGQIMNKDELLSTIKKVKELSPKRKFKQTYDLIITFKHLDLKKPEHQVDAFVQLNHPRGREVKVCGLVAPELKESSKKNCDFTVDVDEFDKYAKDKKLTKKLGNEYDFFVAQANIMTKVAAAFGRILGPKSKMPNPKAGCVVPGNANLQPLVEKLKKTIRVSVKTAPSFQCRIGNEEAPDENIADNALTIYNAISHALPSEIDNIKTVYLKLTMGPAVKVGASTEEKSAKKTKKYIKIEAPKEKKEE
jgi:large subunit ribosomal protein L1